MGRKAKKDYRLPSNEDFEIAYLYGSIGMNETDLYQRLRVPRIVYLEKEEWGDVRDKWREGRFKRKESYCKADIMLLTGLIDRIKNDQPLEAWEIARIERAVDKYSDYEFRAAKQEFIQEQTRLAKAKRELIEQQIENAKNGVEQFIFDVEDLTQDDLDNINNKF